MTTPKGRSDSQRVEIMGRHRLNNELIAAGLEVAVPICDRGVDLIAYADVGIVFAA
jgi:hypothetical protein